MWFIDQSVRAYVCACVSGHCRILWFCYERLVQEVQNQSANVQADARFFLLVDLRDFFSDLGSGDGKKKKKSSENDQLTGHFQSFFHFQSFS